MAMRPKLLMLDAPVEGIQPSIIKPIGPAIMLAGHHFEFATDLADHYAGPGRGRLVLSGAR